MAAINIPIINETEYPSFKNIGVRSQFPEDYSAFLELFGQEKKRFTEKHIITVEININFAGFQGWYGRGRVATYQDLFRYAATIVNSK
jgi:hypothetical protein